MKFKEWFFVILTFSSLGSCSNSSKQQSFNLEEEKKLSYNVGVFYNLTGELAPLDVPAYKGTRLAFDMLVEKFPLLATSLGYTLYDCSSDEDVIAEKAKVIGKRNDLIGALGFTDSNMVLAAVQAIENSKKVFISSAATSPLLTKDSNYIFLAAFGDNAQAAAAAQYASQILHSSKAVILYDKDVEYAKLLRKYFKAAFNSWGGQIIGEEAFAKNSVSIADQLDTFKSLGTIPDLIYLAALPAEIPALIKEIRSQGFNQVIFGSDTFDNRELIISDSVLSDVYFTTHVMLDAQTTNPQINAFINAYIAAYNEYPSSAFAALGFDAANLFFQAVTNAHSFHREDILKAMEEIKNFEGVTGTISYSEANHVPSKAVTIIKVQGDRRFFKTSFIPEKIPDMIQKPE